MIARIATGLAWSSLPEHRWRRVAVPLAASVFILLVLAATSLVVMVQREEGRMARRTALTALVPAPTDLFMFQRINKWRGEQFPVVWIQPAGSAAPVLPPGMTQYPEPGQAVVSPALDQLARQQPNLAAQYPNRLVLDREGIRSEGELLAYVPIPAGRTLTKDDRTIRVRAFGVPSNDEAFQRVGFQDSVTLLQSVVAVLTLLVVPGVIVLAVGVATASNVRDHRFAVLHWIGIPTQWRVTLGMVETLILALPGLVLATIVWGIIAPRLAYVPLVNHIVVAGDLGLAWWLLAAVFSVGVGMTALVATLVTAVRSRTTTARPRPTSERAVITQWRMVPLSVGLLLTLFSRMIVENPGLRSILAVVGILVLLIALPLIFPTVLRVVGTLLHQEQSAAALVAGRTLAWDALRMARPFAGIAVLIMLTIAGGLYVSGVRQAYAFRVEILGNPPVTVRWFDPRPDDVARLARALGTGLIVPVEHDEDNNTLRVGATCRQLAPFIPESACRTEVPFEMSDDAKQRLAEFADAFGAQVQLEESAHIGTSGKALVFDDAPLEVLTERVRIAAMQTLPVAYVTSPRDFIPREAWSDEWIRAGMVLGASALAVGCFIAMIDRLLVTRRHRQHLINLGLSFRKLVVIEMLLFAAPYLVSIVLSLAVGIVLCVLTTYGTDTLIPWDVIGTVFVSALVAGIISMVGVALFGARSALISRT